MTLTEFVLERIAEDEATAKAVTIEPGVLDPTLREWGTYADHAIRWGRARVLAECDAKRRIVALWAEEWPEWHGFGSGLVRTRMTADQFQRVLEAERVLGYLALPYADHEDFQEEWRP